MKQEPMLYNLYVTRAWYNLRDPRCIANVSWLGINNGIVEDTHVGVTMFPGGE